MRESGVFPGDGMKWMVVVWIFRGGGCGMLVER